MQIGNIQTMSWYARLGIFVVTAVVIYGLFGYFVTSGTKAETKDLKDQIAGLLQSNAQAQIAEQRLNEFRASYKRKQEDLEDLKALLPEQRELTKVLQGLQDRARSSNLSLRRFSPKEDVQVDFYSGKPIEVEVTSSFANLRSFYDEMARYQRIVSITDFRINRLSDNDQTSNKTVTAQFLMTAYYVTPENLKKSVPKPATPAPGATGPVPAASPAAAPATAAAIPPPGAAH